MNDSSYLGVSQDDLNGSRWNDGWLGNRAVGWDAESVKASGEKQFHNQRELLVLTDIYAKAVNDLYNAQKLAGQSMGFDKLYGKDTPADYQPQYREDEERDYITLYSQSYNPLSDTKDNGWALYQDGSWEFGDLDTSDQLHDMLALIEESGDGKWAGTSHYRNTAQRSFLAQKAYSRYLFSKVEALGGVPYMNGKHGDYLWEGNMTARKDDSARVQFDRGLHPTWGRDPMYSVLDDGPLDQFAPTEERRQLMRTKYDADYEFMLRDAGILDYVAGRYKSVNEYQSWMNPEEGLDPDAVYFDALSQSYVKLGDQTPGSVWNAAQEQYLAPSNYVWDAAQGAWIDPDEPFLPDVPWIVDADGNTVKNRDFAGTDYGPKPGAGDMPEIAGDDVDVDLNLGWDITPDVDAGFEVIPGLSELPENMELGPDGTLQYTQEYLYAEAALQQTAAEDAAAAQAQADADVAEAQADADEAAADTQALPDETHGATHVHDTPADDHFDTDPPAWTPQQHEHVTYAAQPHISIPLQQIAADIAQGGT